MYTLNNKRKYVYKVRTKKVVNTKKQNGAQSPCHTILGGDGDLSLSIQKDISFKIHKFLVAFEF